MPAIGTGKDRSEEETRSLSKYYISEYSVIPRLDRGIQYFQQALDCPVKPDNDENRLFRKAPLRNSSHSCLYFSLNFNLNLHLSL